jgi:transketolase
MLRSIPNFNVVRPADAKEIVGAYEIALKSKETPTALILSRQNLPTLRGTEASKVIYGAYLVSESDLKHEDAYTIIATGSEVSLALLVKEALETEHQIPVRVVSMPSTHLFDLQDEAYKKKLLPDYSRTIFLEMASPFGLHKYARHVLGIETFGASGKPQELLENFGFTKDKLVTKILELING